MKSNISTQMIPNTVPATDNWQNLISYWHHIQPLIEKGYKILDKEVVMGLPGPCMPASHFQADIGIGTPYGEGAKRVWRFWDKTLHKILLGPGGRTCKKTGHSPYVSDTHPNPFFIPAEGLYEKGLVSQKTLDRFFNLPKIPTKINFNQIEKTFQAVLAEAYQKSGKKSSKQDFIDSLAYHFIQNNTYPYIADLQVQIPNEYVKYNKKLFLSRFTLGAPADVFSTSPQNWNFPVFNPEYLFDEKGALGAGGKLWQQVIRDALKGALGGLRIDHFIAFVNPYVISKNIKIENGRLFSSPHHSILKKYALNKITDFYKIIDKIINPVLKEAQLDVMQLYPEDIGIRPPQMDKVMAHFGLGRFLVAQFKEPTNPHHIYQLNNANSKDIACLDTHDTLSIQAFFDKLNDTQRYLHAKNLADHLRFYYTDDLKSTEQLIRMQWAELLACQAKRIQAFFTSWTGQEGRYNEPENPVSWFLRCAPNFEELYFRNLLKGRAYNPLDAIALAIFARGDDFYNQYKDFVRQLHQAEDKLKDLIKNWIKI